MRERLPLLVLLGSALTFLASLFLPWRETTPPPGLLFSTSGLFTLFKGGGVEGWVSAAGDVAVLVVIARFSRPSRACAVRASLPGYRSGASASRSRTSRSPWRWRFTR